MPAKLSGNVSQRWRPSLSKCADGRTVGTIGNTGLIDNLVAVVDHSRIGVRLSHQLGALAFNSRHQEDFRVYRHDLPAEGIQRRRVHRFFRRRPAVRRGKGNQIHSGIFGERYLTEKCSRRTADKVPSASGNIEDCNAEVHRGYGRCTECTSVSPACRKTERRRAVQVKIGPDAVGRILKNYVDRSIGHSDRTDGVGAADRPMIPALPEILRVRKTARRQDIFPCLRVLNAYIGQPHISRYLWEAKVERAGAIHIVRNEFEKNAMPTATRRRCTRCSWPPKRTAEESVCHPRGSVDRRSFPERER